MNRWHILEENHRSKPESIGQLCPMNQMKVGINAPPCRCKCSNERQAIKLRSLSQVVDECTREMLGPNQAGELCFKGPSVFKEYWNNPEVLHTRVVLIYKFRAAWKLFF